MSPRFERERLLGNVTYPYDVTLTCSWVVVQLCDWIIESEVPLKLSEDYRVIMQNFVLVSQAD